MTVNTVPADDDHEVNLPPGASLRDMLGALAVLPPDATLADFYGDVNLLLFVTPGR